MAIDRSLNRWVSSLPSPELVPQYRGQFAPVSYEVADVVLYNGGLYISHDVTAAGDIPGVSNKWVLLLGGQAVSQLLATANDKLSTVNALLSTYSLKMDTYEGDVSQLREDVLASVTLMESAAKIGRVATRAVLTPVKTAGVYEIVDENVRVYWDGTNVTAQGSLLAMGDTVPQFSTAKYITLEATKTAAENADTTAMQISSTQTLSNPVVITKDANIIGKSTARWIYNYVFGAKDSVIKATQNIKSLIHYVGSKLVSAGWFFADGSEYGGVVGAFSTENVAYVGKNSPGEGGVGAESAIYVDSFGGPIRPFQVLKSTFMGFPKALWFEPLKTGDVTIYKQNPDGSPTLDEQGNPVTSSARIHTTAAVMPVKYNTFTAGTYALYATGWNTIGILDFTNNNSEQGARIFADVKSTFAYVGIKYNLLEGQDGTTVKLGSGYGTQYELRGNYFEANATLNPDGTVNTNGILYDIGGDDYRKSSLKMDSNYVDTPEPTSKLHRLHNIEINEPRMRVRFHDITVKKGVQDVYGWLPDFSQNVDPPEAARLVTWMLSNPSEQLNGQRTHVEYNYSMQQVTNAEFGWYQLPQLFSAVSEQTTKTPLGYHKTFTAASRAKCSAAITTGRVAVFSVLVKTTDNSVKNISVRITDAGETEAVYETGDTPIVVTGEWQLLTLAVKAPKDYPEGLYLNFLAVGQDKVIFSAPYGGVVPDENSLFKVAYPIGLTTAYTTPANGTNAGYNTVPANSTSVTVAHNFGSAPTGVVVTPVRKATMWVDNIQATTFDVHTDSDVTPTAFYWIALRQGG